MSYDTGAELLKFLAANARNCRAMTVTWYGGEPLLSSDLVLKLSTTAKDTLAKLGCEYRSSIVTNGTLLTPELASCLRDAGITHAQLTLDGARADHDRRRVGQKGNPTYDTVLNAISMFLPETRVHLRINTDADNLDGLEDMLEDIAAVEFACEVRVYFARLDCCGGGCDGYARSHGDRLLTENSLLDRVAELLPRACRLGLTVQLPVLDIQLCGAVSRQAIVVEPDGVVKKCWKDVGSQYGSIGKLGQPLKVDNPNLVSWLAHNPFSLPECVDCEVLSTCLGGCPWMVRHGVPQEQRCHSRRHGMRRIQEAVEGLVADGLAEFSAGIVVGLGAKNPK